MATPYNTPSDLIYVRRIQRNRESCADFHTVFDDVVVVFWNQSNRHSSFPVLQFGKSDDDDDDAERLPPIPVFLVIDSVVGIPVSFFG